MGRLLVQIVTGPENPTRAALGLLLAKTAAQGGHEVDVFFGGDGVAYLRPETLDAAQGIGTGSVRDHLDALTGSGATLHASKMSAGARGLTTEQLGGREVRLVTPSDVIELVFAAERVLVY